MKEINVVITMDCEPITSGTHASATGPNTAELGQRATTGYARIAGSLGFPITFFIHPEMALAQADIFLKLENEGACTPGNIRCRGTRERSTSSITAA